MPVVAGDLVYRIDAGDRLCHVNAEWDAFAIANGGAAVDSGRVLGRSLWAFIGEPGVISLYRTLVAGARQGRKARLRFRCDGPAERRLLELTVTGEPRDVVQFRTNQLARSARPREALLDPRVTRHGAALRICSWCNRVRAGDDWTEVEEAVERLHLMLRASVLPPLAHDMCESCGRIIRTAVHGFACDEQVRPGTAVLFSLGDDPAALSND
jgi:hypothetical protein